MAVTDWLGPVLNAATGITGNITGVVRSNRELQEDTKLKQDQTKLIINLLYMVTAVIIVVIVFARFKK
jgi:hypothetical protein